MPLVSGHGLVAAEVEGSVDHAAPRFLWRDLTEVSEVRDVRRPGVSGDGRWIVAEADLDGRSTALRIDRTTGGTVEITPAPESGRSGDTVHPVISADGCVVVVVTELALDPFRDDDVGDRWDVYRQVVPECGGAPGRWELVSTDPDGSSRNDVDPSVPPAVTESGSVIAFSHPADAEPAPSTTRAGSPTARTTTISLVDLTVPVGSVGRIDEVPALPSEAPTGAFWYRGATEPAISADGRIVAFTADTTAHEPLPGWGEGLEPGGWATTQVFVWDRDDPDRRTRIELASASGRTGSVGEPSTGAWAPVVSAEGDVVLFVSADPSLTDTAARVHCEADCPTQVYRYARVGTVAAETPTDPGSSPPAALLSAVSAAPDRSGAPLLGEASSWAPAIDRRGDRIVMSSRAATLVRGRVPIVGSILELPEGEEHAELLVVDPIRSPRRVTEVAGVPEVPPVHGRAAISASGRVVVAEASFGGLDLPFEVLGPIGSVTGRGLVAWVTVPRVALADLDFGTVIPGWEGDELYVSVHNDGPGEFAPATIEVGSPAFRVVDGGTCVRGLLVPAGGSCTVHLAFIPGAEGPHETVLTVAEVSAFPGEAVSVTATVTGAGGEPSLRAEPGGLDLGTAAVGRTGERRAVDIRNIGSVPTEVVAVDLSGRDPGDFRVTAEACTGRALNPGATCAIEIEFAPTAPGLRTASVMATTVDGAHTAAIAGGLAAYRPEIHLSDPQLAPGGRLGVGLLGFPPDVDVRLSLDDGLTTFAVVRVDASGGALAEVTVPRRSRPGDQYVIAQIGDLFAETPVSVSRLPESPAGLPGYGLGQG